MSPSVSFCLIACDEQARMGKCLESVRELCHELLVIDTGSKDDTVACARQLGADVHHFEWIDDFAAARNHGLSLLTGDWVLMLDADEHLIPSAIPAIREQIKKPDCLVINLLRRELGAAQSPWSSVSRLFRRHPDILFERPYHAMIDDSVERLLATDPQWKVHDLDQAAIAHEGYHPEEIAAHNKAERARIAMERYHAQHPRDPYVCNKLGAMLHSLGETSQAESLLQTGLQNVDQSPALAPLRYELHFHLGILHRSREEWDQARIHYGMALQQGLDPRLSIGATFNLAALEQMQGSIDQAIDGLRQVIRLVPDLAQAHVNLGLAYSSKNDSERAESCYLKALQINPDSADANRYLGLLYYAGGKTNQAKACFGKTLACYERQSPQLATAFRRALANSGLKIN